MLATLDGKPGGTGLPFLTALTALASAGRLARLPFPTLAGLLVVAAALHLPQHPLARRQPPELANGPVHAPVVHPDFQMPTQHRFRFGAVRPVLSWFASKCKIILLLNFAVFYHYYRKNRVPFFRKRLTRKLYFPFPAIFIFKTAQSLQTISIITTIDSVNNN